MRLFVALDIPENVRGALAALVNRLRAAWPDARWVRVEGVHVTLKFIGEVPNEKFDVIKTTLASVPGRNVIPLIFKGLGFFPSERRPRVLWAGIECGPDLTALAAAVETALAPVGIPREDRTFTPHLTLARFEAPRNLAALHAAIENAGPVEFGTTTAKEFHLYQSVLKRGGAEYTRLVTYSFTGRTTE